MFADAGEARYRGRILGRETTGGQIMVLRVEKPARFDFIAGQFCFVTAPDLGLGDADGMRKPLSIASSPLEGDLIFIVRITGSAFKRTLRDMADSTGLELEKPKGAFTLPEKTDTPLVFLAGGMGVAPFRSMIAYSAAAKTGHRIGLFYSSRVPEETLFLDEFRQIAAKDPRIRVVATMTRPEQSAHPWDGPTGRLTPSMVTEGCPEWETATYYLSGPPAMVEGMRTMLAEMKIDRGRIKQEIWTGY